MRAGGTALIAAVVFVGVGCELFPAELYQRDGGGPDGGLAPSVTLAERCDEELFVLDQAVVNAHVDLSGHRDDVAASECVESALPGNDAFFGVSMRAGERWHFHLSPRASLGFDPALTVVESCGAACQVGWGIDDCRADQAEHLTVVAPADGVYVVGLDSPQPGGGVYDLLVSQPDCGNGGGPEHGETCDDGGTTSGDGCDDRCRAELADGDREREPNDDVTAANVLTGPISVRGNIGGRCDVDHYTFEHPGGSLSLELRAEVGECTEPSVTLTLTDESGAVLAGGAAATGACAVLSTPLDAGTYHVQVRADPMAPDLPYVLGAAW